MMVGDTTALAGAARYASLSTEERHKYEADLWMRLIRLRGSTAKGLASHRAELIRQLAAIKAVNDLNLSLSSVAEQE